VGFVGSVALSGLLADSAWFIVGADKRTEWIAPPLEPGAYPFRLTLEQERKYGDSVIRFYSFEREHRES
jgi:hypothetical protein